MQGKNVVRVEKRGVGCCVVGNWDESRARESRPDGEVGSMAATVEGLSLWSQPWSEAKRGGFWPQLLASIKKVYMW